MKSSPRSPGSSRLIASSTDVWAMESLADRTPTPWNRKPRQASWQRGFYWGKLQRTFRSIHGPPALVHVDWRQLGHWNIPASALPPGAIISYRQPTGWQRYAKYVAAVVLLFLVQAMLIIGLLWQRARNRKADLRLRESEKRFRLMADTTPALIWMCDKEGTVTLSE